MQAKMCPQLSHEVRVEKRIKTNMGSVRHSDKVEPNHLLALISNPFVMSEGETALFDPLSSFSKEFLLNVLFL